MPLFGTGGGAVGTMKQFGYHYQRSILIIVGIVFALVVFCDDHDIVFYMNGNIESLAVDSIDSITFPYEESFMLVALHNREPKLFARIDSVKFLENLGDTILLSFQDDKIRIVNPRADIVDVTIKETDVEIVSNASERLVILADGHCNDGRIVIDNNGDCTLILSDLQLNSKKGSAIYLKQKQKVSIELPVGTHSTLSDASMYSVDSTDTSNGCLYNKGSIVFKGEGTLTVTGNYRHGIASGKNVSVEGGCIIINDAIKNGVNCDKFTMKDGNVSLHLSQDASKGIKAKEQIDILGGYIEGESIGNVTIKDGDVSYCTLMKSDGLMSIAGGEIKLTNEGKGGRCISVDGNLIVTSGTMSLECNGDGSNYINEEGEVDYYTPKCITADGNMSLERGQLHLLATGNGGKGIDCSDTLFVGREGEDFIPEDSLLINVETRGTALVDNVDEDYREGCPKAIKADKDIELYSGNLNIATKGQGGEGVESKATIYAHHVAIMADTYDDSFNTRICCNIDGSHIYCLSHNNDGIDSNGSIVILEGIVVSINQKKPNESFDAEDGQLYLLGGTVFGIGSGPVDVSMTKYPCYSTPYGYEDEWIRSNGLILNTGKYVYVRKGEAAYMALRNDNEAFRSFITVASPVFVEGESFTISEGERPTDAQEIYFGGRLFLDCSPKDIRDVIDETFAIKQ